MNPRFASAARNLSRGLTLALLLGLAPLAGVGDRPGASLQEAVAASEREAIREALEASGGNKSLAASRLGITRKSLYRRMAKYGLGSGRQ